jgi:hypothetical protein
MAVLIGCMAKMHLHRNIKPSEPMHTVRTCSQSSSEGQFTSVYFDERSLRWYLDRRS